MQKEFDGEKMRTEERRRKKRFSSEPMIK